MVDLACSSRVLTGCTECKALIDRADSPRLDGRDLGGNRTERALEEFSIWFLKICLDQINFMSGLFDLGHLAERLKRCAQLQGWRNEAGVLLVETLHRGEIARGDAAAITGLGERMARDLLGEVICGGLLGSQTERGAITLRFPIEAQDVLFPRLFSDVWEASVTH